MQFNPNKTEILLISNRKLDTLPVFTLNNNFIPIIEYRKHLGVIFSNDAKWNTHIDNIIKKVFKFLRYNYVFWLYF